MWRAKVEKCSFKVQEGDFLSVYDFAESLLSRKGINDELAKEALIVFEALMQKLVDWGLDEETEIEVSGFDRLGDYLIRVGFEGAMFTRGIGVVDSIEDRILDGHDDKLDYSYHSGYNTITISVSRGNSTSILSCTVATLCAAAVYVPISFLLDVNEQYALLDNYVFPLETLYGNAMLMVGAPMTFFSLLKNLTDTYVVSQRNTGARRLQAHTLATSAFAILTAFVTFIITSSAISSLEGTTSEISKEINRSFADVITSLVPHSIFEPFEAISPIPLMVVALLCTYALCSSGKYFDMLRQAMMACYTLFSRMLHVIIAVLPFFCFLAILDMLLDVGVADTVAALIFIISIYISILLLLVTYVFRLRSHGVRVIPFVRKLVPLLRENARIGSAIDAAPYNIRYCSRNLGMNRALLERNLPVLAEVNLDGNCFILMSLTLYFIFATGTGLPLVSFLGLAALVLFLSLGAPNQPGSILIGTLIITMYLDSFEVVCVAIFSEAFLGVAQNLVNVIGDIVMVAIEDSKMHAQTEGESGVGN